jgi:hypothetical protein
MITVFILVSSRGIEKVFFGDPTTNHDVISFIEEKEGIPVSIKRKTVSGHV